MLANLPAGSGQAFSRLQVTEHEVVEDEAVEDGDALVIRGQNGAVHTARVLGIEPAARLAGITWTCIGSAPKAG